MSRDVDAVDPLPPLPSPPTPFVPRPALVDAVVDLAEANRLVTVVGMGGIGKTRLAIECGRQLAARGHRVGFTTLADVSDPATLTDVLAADLGVSVAPEAVTFDGLVVRLATPASLLIVDNLEHLLAAAPLLTQLLDRCATLRILATSRVPLGLPAEVIVEVPPLDSEAVDLFLARVGRLETDDEFAVVTDLCRRTGGIPLAIELAASRARSLGAGAVLQLLSSGPLLDGLGSGPIDGPSRHREFRRCLEGSYQSLSDDGRDVLRVVGAFVGSFDLAAVRDVGADPTTAADGLGELVDHHLVQRFSTGRDVRFTMNPVIREFARELLDASPERDTVDHAHAVWCASIAREIRHAFEHVSVAEALNGLERNDPNISASVARLVANGRYAEAASMAIDLAPVRASVWHESTIIEWFRATALKAETASVELPIEALMWSAYGDVVERSASVPAGLRRLIELIDRAREVHDHRALMLGLDLVVRSTTWHGDVAESMRSVAEGVEIAEMIGARRSATEFATWQATLGYVAGDTTGAGGLATHALRLAREFDDPILILRAGVLVAIMATFTPTGGGPAPSFESLLDLARETDSAVDELTIILQIVNRDAFAGDRAVFQPALDGLKLAHRLCAPMREAAVVFALSAAAANFGDMEVAARLHAAMLSMWPAIVASVPPNVVEQYEGIVARCREVAPDRFDELLRVGAPTDWNETRRVATGYAHANAAAPPVAGRSQSPELTAREHDVLLALTRGWTNKQIAQDLGMRPKTVTHHCAAIFRKLNVRTRSEATAYAFRHGLTDGGSDQPPRPVDGR